MHSWIIGLHTIAEVVRITRQPQLNRDVEPIVVALTRIIIPFQEDRGAMEAIAWIQDGFRDLPRKYNRILEIDDLQLHLLILIDAEKDVFWTTIEMRYLSRV